MQYPSTINDQELDHAFIEFFTIRIKNIPVELLAKKRDLGAVSSIDSAEDSCSSDFDASDPVGNDEVVLMLICRSTMKAC